MDTATLKTFEISIPQEYANTIRKIVQGLGGKVHARKKKKCGLDEALEDIKAGRISKGYTDVDELWKDLMA